MDAKNTFLDGDLDKEIYMAKPYGFQIPKKEHQICRLLGSLYGQKQAARG